MHRILLDGADFHDIPGFYAELNRQFMSGEDWSLGQSLDALEDLLHGGIGSFPADGPVELVWRNLAKSREDLGLAATRGWLMAKLAAPSGFDTGRIRRQLEDLEAGRGQTYFDIILEILSGHPRIRLLEG